MKIMNNIFPNFGMLPVDLGMTLSFRKEEEINLSKWGGVSHKYTIDQFTRIADRGHMRIADVWQDKQKNAAIFCLRKKN